MRSLQCSLLFLVFLLSTITMASDDFKVYNDQFGMPRCLEAQNNETRIIFTWDRFLSLKKRAISYHYFKGNLKYTNVCKNWRKFDSNILMKEGKPIHFVNNRAPEYLKGFTLNNQLRLALEQVASGLNRFIPQDGFYNLKYLKSIFEPFKMDTHKELLRDVGLGFTTNLYHAYTKRSGLTNDCSKLVGTCEYYLCREQEKSCGANGYFLGFGYQYCSDSLKRLIHEVSPIGKKWLKTTATCLHEQLEEIPNQYTCAEFKKTAIASHDKCYSEVSFCSLEFTDITKIIKMIFPALTETGVMTEGMQVLAHCAGI